MRTSRYLESMLNACEFVSSFKDTRSRKLDEAKALTVDCISTKNNNDMKICIVRNFEIYKFTNFTFYIILHFTNNLHFADVCNSRNAGNYHSEFGVFGILGFLLFIIIIESKKLQWNRPSTLSAHKFRTHSVRANNRGRNYILVF